VKTNTLQSCHPPSKESTIRIRTTRLKLSRVMPQPTFDCGLCLFEKTNPIPVADDMICRECFDRFLFPQLRAAATSFGEFPVRWGPTILHLKDFATYVHITRGLHRKWKARMQEYEKRAGSRQIRDDLLLQGLVLGKHFQCCPSEKCGIPIQLKRWVQLFNMPAVLYTLLLRVWTGSKRGRRPLGQDRREPQSVSTVEPQRGGSRRSS
jgi:hypothetical protein